MNSIRFSNGPRASKRSNPGMGGIQDAGAVRLHHPPPVPGVRHLVRQVGLGPEPVDAVLRADVDLPVPGPDPQPAPARQGGWLHDVGQPEHAAVEVPRPHLGTGGDRDLGVVEPGDHSAVPGRLPAAPAARDRVLAAGADAVGRPSMRMSPGQLRSGGSAPRARFSWAGPQAAAWPRSPSS